MNWETYKTLTPKEKEEYNWRFKEPIAYPNLLTPVIIMFSLVTIFIFTAYLAVTHPEFDIQKENIKVLMNGCLNIMLITSWWILVIGVEYIIKSIIKEYKYKKWKKENKIKEIYWWSTWVKKE